MTTRITRADLDRAIVNLDRAATSAGYLTPNGHALAIEIGSKVNGIAYRVTYLPTGDYAADPNARRELCPLWSQGVVGRTASQAYDSITTMTYALDAVSRRQAPALKPTPYTPPMSSEAASSVAGTLVRDWGPDRFIVAMWGQGNGSAMAECGAWDGGVGWFIGATRYGNTVWNVSRSECVAMLDAEMARERALLADSAT